jgi:hypothetical protein
MLKNKNKVILFLFISFISNILYPNKEYVKREQENKTILINDEKKATRSIREFISHLDSLLCLYIVEGQYLLKTLSQNEIQEVETHYKNKENKSLSLEVRSIDNVLVKIKKNFKEIGQESIFSKVKAYFYSSQPPYIKNFLKQIKRAESFSSITQTILDKYFYYISFFLKYATVHQKNIFDYASLHTFNIIKEEYKDQNFFSFLSTKKHNNLLKSYPSFDYKKIYNDLSSIEGKKTFFNKKKILTSLALSIATGTVLYLEKYNNPFNLNQEKKNPEKTSDKTAIQSGLLQTERPQILEAPNNGEEQANYTTSILPMDKKQALDLACMIATLVLKGHSGYLLKRNSKNLKALTSRAFDHLGQTWGKYITTSPQKKKVIKIQQIQGKPPYATVRNKKILDKLVHEAVEKSTKQVDQKLYNSPGFYKPNTVYTSPFK